MAAPVGCNGSFPPKNNSTLSALRPALWLEPGYRAFFNVLTPDHGEHATARHFAAARSRSTITATLPRMPRPAFSDCSPALIASTVLSIVWLTCGTTSPCIAHSIARAIPR